MTPRALAAWSAVILLGAFQVLALTLPGAALLGSQSVAAINGQLIDPPTPLALCTAVLFAAVPGTILAIAMWRLRLSALVAGFMLAPLLVPAILAGSPGDALAVLLLRHASLGLALGTACGLIRLRAVDLGVLRAAACCGLSPRDILRRVLLPLVMPGMVAAALLSATASLALSLATRAGPILGPVLHGLPASVWLAASGAAVAVSAVTGASLLLLRR